MKSCFRVLLPLLGAAATVTAAPVRYVEGEVLVTFKPWRDVWSADQTLQRHSLKFQKRFGLLSKLRLRQIGLVRSDHKSTAMLIADLKADPAVETVEPNYLRYTSAVPNDPGFSNLWGLHNTGQTVLGITGTAGADMKYVEARPLFRPSASRPIVAVMDTGMDRLHPDLQPNLWVNPGEIPGNGIDDEGDGRIDDLYGFDFSANTSNTADTQYDGASHGTHVAGTIAAVGNNQLGVIGSNEQARLMILKVSPDGHAISAAAEIAALQYAVLMKTRGENLVAINASFGGAAFSTTERDAIQAAGNAGIVFCCAAGNETANNDSVATYPANHRLSNMIVVAATDQNDALATFSNYGATKVDLAAPGVNIYSTQPCTINSALQVGATFYSATGTSQSGTTAGITGTLVDCGIGNPADFPPAVNNNIALIQRGIILFSEKVANAMAAGAKAVVIYNNQSGSNGFTLNSDNVNWIPACGISQTDGLALKAALPKTATITSARQDNYLYLNGTSMATPQVCAAVSVAAMCFPEDTVAQRIQRILTNVDVKASLAGKVITSGRLNLQRIVDSDLNSLPDWWEKLYYNQYTGIAPGGDSDGDGMTNLNEFLGGTVPTNSQSALKSLATTRNSANGNVTITWATVPGKTYQVYYSTNLQSGSWLATLPASLVTAGVGETQMSYTDLTAGATTRRFYRVQLVVQ